MLLIKCCINNDHGKVYRKMFVPAAESITQCSGNEMTLPPIVPSEMFSLGLYRMLLNQCVKTVNNPGRFTEMNLKVHLYKGPIP